MRYAVDFMNNRHEASPQLKGRELFCPHCEGFVIPKTGKIKAYHFAHHGADCEYFKYKGMSKWHTDWQNLFKKDQQEVRVTKGDKTHIADVKNSNGVVIEFQHSGITMEEKNKRDDFYEKLIWVVDVASVKHNVTIGKKWIPTEDYKEYGRGDWSFNYDIKSKVEDLDRVIPIIHTLDLSGSDFNTISEIITQAKEKVRQIKRPPFLGEKYLKNTVRLGWKWPRTVWLAYCDLVPVFLDLGGEYLYRIISDNRCSPYKRKDFIDRYCV